MRSKLLWSFLFVLGFWWCATLFWWFTSPPGVALNRLTHTSTLLPWARAVPHLKPTVFDFWDIQINTLRFWTGPLLLIGTAWTLLAAALVWFWAYTHLKERKNRVAPSDDYRGVGISLGILPVPMPPERVSVAIEDKGGGGSPFKKLSCLQRDLIEETLSTLAAIDHDRAETTLHKIERALDLPNPGLCAIVEVLSEISDQPAVRGRVLSSLDQWWQLAPVDRFALLLATKNRGNGSDVPTMTGLPDATLRAKEILLAIDGQEALEAAPVAISRPVETKNSDEDEIPEPIEEPFIEDDPSQSAPEAAQAAPVREEKSSHAAPATAAVPAQPVAAPPAMARVEDDKRSTPPAAVKTQEPPRAPQPVVSVAGLNKHSKPTGLLDIFCNELPRIPLRIAGVAHPKNILPMGWKKKGKLYLIEKAIVEHLWHKLSQDLKEQFADAPTGPKSPLTRALLEVLHLEGWLITKNNQDELEPREALWVVKAGKIDFKGVFILSRLPERLMDLLPTEDSAYEMKILKPLFFPSKNPEKPPTPGQMLDRRELAGNLEAEIASAGATSRMSLDELLGGLLRKPEDADQKQKPKEG